MFLLLLLPIFHRNIHQYYCRPSRLLPRHHRRLSSSPFTPHPTSSLTSRFQPHRRGPPSPSSLTVALPPPSSLTSRPRLSSLPFTPPPTSLLTSRFRPHRQGQPSPSSPTVALPPPSSLTRRTRLSSSTFNPPPTSWTEPETFAVALSNNV